MDSISTLCMILHVSPKEAYEKSVENPEQLKSLTRGKKNMQ